MGYNYINIFSVSRSGGTYLQTFLQNCVQKRSKNYHAYHEREFSKSNIEELLKDKNNQCTFMIKRHPYALYMSMTLINFTKGFDSKGMHFKVSEKSNWSTMKFFRDEVDKFINIVYNNFKDKMPILRYEDFHNNNKYIEEFLKNNFNIDLDQNLLNEFYNDFGSTDNLLKLKKEKPQIYKGKFQNAHISVGKGDNLSNLRFIPNEYREEFKRQVDPYVKALGYEPYDLDQIEHDPIV